MYLGTWLALAAAAAAAASSPAICDPGVVQHSGYIDVGRERHLFYWFFEARRPRQQTPLILWLNGGPGCSSLSGLLGSVGPCRVDASGNRTTPNEHSWNTNAHMLFLDQPANTGYSYGANVSRTVDAAQDVAALLRQFLAQFPQYAGGPLHVMGESYAAHYVPVIAAQIIRDNGSPGLPPLPLASIAVGNGLFDITRQYMHLPQMACASGYPPIVNATICREMTDASVQFARQIAAARQQPWTAQAAANITSAGYDILTPYQRAGGNPYDVRAPCAGGSLCDPYMDTVVAFANRPWVRAALGVPPHREFELCNPDVQRAFIDSGDELEDASRWIPGLLAAGVRVLNFAGDADLICNWIGNKALTMDLPWPGRPAFAMAPDRPWWAAGRLAGQARAFGGLAFLRIAAAGHMAAKDQPVAALEMLTQWLDYGTLIA